MGHQGVLFEEDFVALGAMVTPVDVVHGLVRFVPVLVQEHLVADVARVSTRHRFAMGRLQICKKQSFIEIGTLVYEYQHNLSTHFVSLQNPPFLEALLARLARKSLDVALGYDLHWCRIPLRFTPIELVLAFHLKQPGSSSSSSSSTIASP